MKNPILPYKGMTKSQGWVEQQICEQRLGKHRMEIHLKQESLVARSMAKHFANLKRKEDQLVPRMHGIRDTLLNMGKAELSRAFKMKLDCLSFLRVDHLPEYTHVLSGEYEKMRMEFENIMDRECKMMYSVSFELEMRLTQYKNKEMENMLDGLKEHLTKTELNEVYTLHPNPSSAKRTLESLRAARPVLEELSWEDYRKLTENVRGCTSSNLMKKFIEMVLPRKVTAFEKAVLHEAVRKERTLSAVNVICRGELLDYEDQVAASKKEPPQMPRLVKDLWFPLISMKAVE
jgi:hypothetical protein